MKEHSELFIRLDVSKLKTSVALAEDGRDGEVRFFGDIDASPASIAALATKPVLCSSCHRLPLLALLVSRYVPCSSLFDRGNSHERDADYFDFTRQTIGSRRRDRTS